MLSELKQVIRRVQKWSDRAKAIDRNGSCMECSMHCWGILSFNKTYQFYHVSISTADFFNFIAK